MKLGYACINKTLNTSFRTCRIATVQKRGSEIIKELTIKNFQTVLDTLIWNAKNNIFLYRLSGTIVPFVTHEIFDWNWINDSDVLNLIKKINKIRKEHKMRLTCHPAHYCPLNSFNEKILNNTFKDFNYHNQLMNLVGGTDIIIHTGGMYGNKNLAKKSFINNYNKLDTNVKNKLRLENDDKVFNIEDVIEISLECGIPICLDIHHHNCNPISDIKKRIYDVVKTWDGYGTPKVHISTGKTSNVDIAHADYVSKEDFLNLINILNGYDVDIMLESKAKELSVLKIQKNFKEALK